MALENNIEADNLSLAWGRAIKLVSAPGRREVAPLIVSVTGFDGDGNFAEDATIRAALDAHLQDAGKQSVATVANTIFPIALWNPSASRTEFFKRYARIASRIRNASRMNSRGIYFERMVTNGAVDRENQLEFIIATYGTQKGFRRSVLQVSVFDPKKDHCADARPGFPCLQHVTFAPTTAGLNVNAFYASQYMVERAYGNYVGLCRLGQFVARELAMPLAQFTCYAGIAKLDDGITKKSVMPLLHVVDTAMQQSEES